MTPRPALFLIGTAGFLLLASAAAADPRIVYRALRPALWRPLGLAWRVGADEGATRQVIEVLKAGRAEP